MFNWFQYVPYHCVCSPFTSIARPKSANSKKKRIEWRSILNAVCFFGWKEKVVPFRFFSSPEIELHYSFNPESFITLTDSCAFAFTCEQKIFRLNEAEANLLFFCSMFLLEFTFKSLCTMLLSWQCRTASRICWMQWLKNSKMKSRPSSSFPLTLHPLRCRILEQRYLRIILHRWL